MPLIPDQPFDGTEQSKIKLVRESEVEKLGLTCGPLQLPEIESAAERRNLLGEALRTDFNPPPVKAIPRHSEDVALLANEPEEECFIDTKQLLHFLGFERLRIRERRIFREFLLDVCSRGDQLTLDIDDVLTKCF